MKSVSFLGETLPEALVGCVGKVRSSSCDFKRKFWKIFFSSQIFFTLIFFHEILVHKILEIYGKLFFKIKKNPWWKKCFSKIPFKIARGRPHLSNATNQSFWECLSTEYHMFKDGKGTNPTLRAILKSPSSHYEHGSEYRFRFRRTEIH